jgi:hypothetical protein
MRIFLQNLHQACPSFVVLPGGDEEFGEFDPDRQGELAVAAVDGFGVAQKGVSGPAIFQLQLGHRQLIPRLDAVGALNVGAREERFGALVLPVLHGHKALRVILLEGGFSAGR